MSEPNSPLKPQAEPGLESSLEWWNPFPELTETETMGEQHGKPQPAISLEPAEADPSKAPLTGEALSDASQELSPIAPTAVANQADVDGLLQGNIAHLVPDGEASDPLLAEPPSLLDLISLIQELNQCNGVLLDRVSQLEEALDRSQQALQGQTGRSAESTIAVQIEDPAAAQAQVANLFSQLEFAHQTNQRQHILIETLTAELESSQERAAQLEREAALLQQRYSEQTQLLVQSEGSCRDLQARLQRQQRYTLQFKAALEKCLDMPVPQSEGTETIAPPIDSLQLPKAQQIQPWSQSTAPQESLLPWMKRFKYATGGVLPDVEQETSEVEALLSEIAPVDEGIAAQEAVQPHLQPKASVVQLPVLAPIESTVAYEPESQQPANFPIEPIESAAIESVTTESVTIESVTIESVAIEPVAEETQDIAAENPLAASISYNLKTPAGIVPSPLLNQIDAVVQPLADRLAEVLLAQATAAEASQEPAQQELAPLDLPAPPVPIESSVDESNDIIVSDPESLLAAAMSEAEDALWQDLARLMEVSPEEAVRASLTGDLAAFESLNFESLPDRAELPQMAQTRDAEFIEVESLTLQPGIPGPAPEAISSDRAESPELRRAGDKANPVAQLPFAERNPPAAPDIASAAPVANSPSPLLNPHRPTQKKRSLSSVELPSFLRQGDSKPLPT